MRHRKNSNKTLERKVALSVTFFGMCFLSLGSCKPSEIKEEILPYQGYTYNEDRTKMLVFDEKPRNLRTGFPLTICGSDSGLIIGETYIVKYKPPKLKFLSQNKLHSFKTYNSSFSSNQNSF